jgi:hypothetical protein
MLVVRDLRTDTWLDRACQIANRNLSAEEWSLVAGDAPYHKTCPKLP